MLLKAASGIELGGLLTFLIGQQLWVFYCGQFSEDTLVSEA